MRVLERNSKEYKMMEAVAKNLEALSIHNCKYEVKDVYFDCGQDWMWTTICRKGDDCLGDTQVLNPMEWQMIITATTMSDIAKVVEEIRNGEYFHD